MTLLGILIGSGAITKFGPGTLVVTNADDRTGATTVSLGTLDLTGGADEALVASVTINPTAILMIDNTTANNAARIGSGVPLTLQAGTINYLSNNTPNTVTTQTFGAVTVSAGSSTFNSVAGTGAGDTTSINIATVTRSGGGLLNFVGVNQPLSDSFSSPGGANQITVTGTGGGTLSSILNTEPQVAGLTAGTFAISPVGPVKVNGGFLVPWTTVAFAASPGNNPTTLDFGSVDGPSINNNPIAGPYSIIPFSNYISETLGSAGSSDVVLVSSNDSSVTSSTVNAAAVKITGAGTTISGGGTLHLTYGAIIATGANETISANLSPGTPTGGPVEGYLLTGANAGLNITGVISTPAGTVSTGSTASHPMTIGGQGTLTLSGTNTYQTLGTSTEVDGGTVVLNGNAAFGTNTLSSTTNTNPVAVWGGTIQSGLTTGISIGNPLALQLGAGAVPGDLLPGAALAIVGNNPLTLGGLISGSGGLTLVSSTATGTTPTVTFDGTVSNTYTGFTTVNGGTLTLTMASTAVNALAGPVAINGGTLQQSAVGTSPASQLDAQNVQISAGGTLALLNSAPDTINALTFVNGGTVATGTGTLTLNADLQTIANSGSPSTATISGILSLGLGAAILNVASSGNTGNTPDLNVSATIIGASGDGIAKENSGTVAFSGTANNTYNGQTTVVSGTLLLNMQTNAEAYGGTLVINGYGSVGDAVKVISNFSQLFTTAGVTINGAAGTLDISGSTAAQTITTLDLRGGTLLTGTSTLNLNGTVTGMPIGTKSGSISGKLALASTQIFSAADASGQPGLIVQATIVNGPGGAGGITKQGTGTVELANSVSNTYSAATTVNEGTLLLNTTGSANEVQNLVFSASSGTITGGTFTLTVNGSTSTATTANIAYTTAGTNFSGLITNIQNALNALANVQPGNAVVALGSQNASGPTLTVTFVNQLGSQSILAMGRSSSLSGGTAPTLAVPTIATPGVAVLAVPGKFVIGNFQGGSAAVGAVGGKAQVVRELGNDEISATSAVTVNNSGWLDIDGNVQTLSNSVGNALTLVGGAVTTEAGTLALSGTLAGQTYAGNQTAATISGNLSLGLARPTPC